MAVAVETVRQAGPSQLPADSEPWWRISRLRTAGLIALALAALLPVPFGDFGYFVGQFALVYTILGLSIVVVTGYAGLISLMPYSFAGIGAMVAGLAMASWGWPFWLAIPLAALATVPISIAIGIASVRLKGLYLAIATLTFANLLGETFFKWDDVTGGVQGWTITRPAIGPIDFSSDLAFYLLCLATVFVVLWMVEGLRRSRLGRAMLAVRDNELEAQALGINVYKTKLVALMLGGMLAGAGGAYLLGLLVTATPEPFQSPLVESTSVLLLGTVAIGGIQSPFGAFIGAIALVVQQQVFGGAEFFFAFFGIYTALVVILLLRFRPGGLVQVGQLQIELIRKRPVLGSVIAASILAVNGGIAYLFVRLS